MKRFILVTMLLAMGCQGAPYTLCDEATLCPAELRCRPMLVGGFACVAPTDTCGDGVVNALTEECEAKSVGTCSTPGVNLCENCRLAPGCSICGDGRVTGQEQCDPGDDADRAGCSADCRSNGKCGNGIVDTASARPEVCDDGNLDSGDGCRGDCYSREVCGDGVLDVTTGEQCDVGLAGLSSDGCSSACQVEVDNWQNLTPAAISARADHAMAFDADRSLVVVFGGVSAGGDLGDTWELHGDQWKRHRATGPAPRSRAAMAYDRTRRRIVLHGGYSELLGVLSDTWEFNGDRWREVPTTNSPGPRFGHSMVYDGVRNQLVLFGGARVVGTATMPTDVWTFDGTAWQMRNTTGGPAGRTGFAMVADERSSSSGSILVIGGSDANSEFADVWQLDDTVWSAKPGLPIAGAMVAAHKADTHEVVVYQRTLNAAWCTPNCGERLFHYNWALGQWTTRTVVGSQLVAGHRMVTNERGEVVWFGGRNVGLSNPLYLADTAVYVTVAGAMWQPVVSEEQHFVDGAATFDSWRGELVYVGGTRIVGDGISDETWEYDGAGWRKRNLALTPGRRQLAGMAFDASRGYAILFGGDNGTSVLADTWRYDGVAWTRTAQTGAAPPARVEARLAYDAALRHVVMMDGYADVGRELPRNDAWRFDGTQWHAIPTTGLPVPRHNFGLVYHAARQRLTALVGTTAAAAPAAWEFDGTVWLPVQPNTGPAVLPAATDHTAYVYDDGRRGVLAFGLRRTWQTHALRADGWQLRATATEPPRMRRFAAAWDSRSHAVLMVGGIADGAGPSKVPNVWRYQFGTAAQPLEACQAGLDGDGDGLVACGTQALRTPQSVRPPDADPDCDGFCYPACPLSLPPALCELAAPRCGDGICNGALEALACADDC